MVLQVEGMCLGQEYLWTGMQFDDYSYCYGPGFLGFPYDDVSEQPYWVSECDKLNCKRFKEGCSMGGGSYQRTNSGNGSTLPTARHYTNFCMLKRVVYVSDCLHLLQAGCGLSALAAMHKTCKQT